MSIEKTFCNIVVPISVGELIDKITILEIKKKYMSGEKMKNVNNEFKSLKVILNNEKLEVDQNLYLKLKDINSSLWKIEDQIRIKESLKEFDEDFIELARSVYKINDERSLIKREINLKYNSGIFEEKSYKNYLSS